MYIANLPEFQPWCKIESCVETVFFKYSNKVHVQPIKDNESVTYAEVHKKGNNFSQIIVEHARIECRFELTTLHFIYCTPTFVLQSLYM